MKRIIVRFVDVILSFLGLVIFSPLFVIIALLIIINSEGSVLTVDKQNSYNTNNTIKIYTFRTVLAEKYSYDKNGNILDYHKRVTNIGRVLIKTGLDKLPMLFNVLKGDISCKYLILD